MKCNIYDLSSSQSTFPTTSTTLQVSIVSIFFFFLLFIQTKYFKPKWEIIVNAVNNSQNY